MRFYEKGSDMYFGDFDAADCYRIEQTELYQKHMKPHGICSVDFLLLASCNNKDGQKLMVVEAKKTISARDTSDFHCNLEGIARQFMDSLQLAWGIWLGSHERGTSLPDNYERFFKKGRRILLVLVIKKRKSDMLYIADILKNKYLRDERRFLGFDVLVLNEQQATRANLVIM